MKPLKILVNGEGRIEFARFIPHLNNSGVHSFGLRLREIDIITRPGKPAAMRPGYNEMMTFGIHGGYILLAFYPFGLGIEIMFMERFPFLNLSVYKAEINYDVDDDDE